MSEADEPEKSHRPPSRWHESEAIRVALLTSLFALLVAVVSGGFSFYAAWTAKRGKDRELDIKFVEIGVAILRADPKDENSAKIREWAIDIVDRYSPRKFTAAEKAQLQDKAIKAKGYDAGHADSIYGGGYSDGYFSDGGPDLPARRKPSEPKDQAPNKPPK